MDSVQSKGRNDKAGPSDSISAAMRLGIRRGTRTEKAGYENWPPTTRTSRSFGDMTRSSVVIWVMGSAVKTCDPRSPLLARAAPRVAFTSEQLNERQSPLAEVMRQRIPTQLMVAMSLYEWDSTMVYSHQH